MSGQRRFSVDETVRRHKPAPEAYHSVASALKPVRTHSGVPFRWVACCMFAVSLAAVARSHIVRSASGPGPVTVYGGKHHCCHEIP